jgi:hypothetical protein
MLAYPEAVRRFQDLRSGLKIPDDAEFFSVEKRHIEQLPSGEIEGREEAPTPGASEADVTARPAWVAEFTKDFLFWEVAIDGRGDLVRLRKSR